MHHAVVHHQQAFSVLLDHGTRLCVVDEVDAFLARIGDEEAAELSVRQPLADLHEQPVVDLSERAFLDKQRQQIRARLRHQMAAALTRIGVERVVDGEGENGRGHGKQKDRPHHGQSRRPGRVDHGELGIRVHRAERLGHRYHQRERHDDRDDGGQDESRELEEGERGLAAVGDEIDAGKHLRRPDDRERPEQCGGEHFECAPQDVEFDDLHQAGVSRPRCAGCLPASGVRNLSAATLQHNAA